MNKKNTDNKFQKMTEAPIPGLIITLSIPTIISMMVSNFYNMVDTAFVGSLGNSASGATGVVFGYLAILQAIGFLFGQGSGSILSRKLGEGDVDEASKTASTAFFTAFAISVLVAIISFFNLDRIVMLLGSTETIAPYAKDYIKYILLAAPFLTTSFTLNNILRYEGRAALGMIGLTSGAIVNICGDYLLIYVFNMGIAGAGISTAISQLLSFGILISIFLMGKTKCKITLKNCQFTFAMLENIITTGLPSLLRQGLNSISTVLMNYEAAAYGDEAVAAMSIVSRIIFFTFSIAIGIGQGFQPVSGFNYGAKKYDRLKKAYLFTFVLSEILLCIIAGFLLINPEEIIRYFRDDASVISIALRALRLQTFAQLALPFSMVTEMLFQSTGKKLFATTLSACRNGLFNIPILIIMANIRGLSGIQEAQPLSYLISLIPSAIFAVLFFKELNKSMAEAKEKI